MQDDSKKNLGFSDFLTVDYKNDGDDLISYQAHKRHRGVVGEEAEVEVDEELSRVQRMKASQRMKRYSKKIARAKERALRRAPSMDVLQKRAKKQARNQMIKKWTRGQDKSDLAVGRKAELEKRLKKMGPKLDRLAKRMMPQLRKADRERRSGAGSSKKD